MTTSNIINDDKYFDYTSKCPINYHDAMDDIVVIPDDKLERNLGRPGIQDENYYDGYESADEINIEVTDCINGKLSTEVYTVPYRPTHCNEKRLICFSILNNEKCCYGNNCTYAHSLCEQIIDEDKKFIYQIILDKNLMNFFSMTNPKTEEIYKNLLFLSHMCENCKSKKCTGGFNCRNGVCDFSLKLCKNDLLTGECLNKVININVDPTIIAKLNFNNFEDNGTYQGCINGHHLTNRGLLPYYKFVHQKESSRKNKYQSVRYIDISPLNKIFKNNYSSGFNNESNYCSDSESSTDEEINSWFQKKNEYTTDSDDDDE